MNSGLLGKGIFSSFLSVDFSPGRLTHGDKLFCPDVPVSSSRFNRPFHHLSDFLSIRCMNEIKGRKVRSAGVLRQLPGLFFLPVTNYASQVTERRSRPCDKLLGEVNLEGRDEDYGV